MELLSLLPTAWGNYLSMALFLLLCLLYTSPSPRDQRGSGLAGGA